MVLKGREKSEIPFVSLTRSCSKDTKKKRSGSRAIPLRVLLAALVRVKVELERYGQFHVGGGDAGRGRDRAGAKTRGRLGLPRGDLRAQRHERLGGGLGGWRG